MSRSKVLIFLLIVAILLVFTASILNILHVLNELGVYSIFAKISLDDRTKTYISLHLALSILSFGLLSAGACFGRKGQTHSAGLAAALGAIFELSSLISTQFFGFILSPTGILIGALGIVFSLISAISGFFTSPVQAVAKPFVLPYEIALSSVMSALTAVVTIITGALIPSPTGGYTHIGDMIIFVAALLFGSKVGGITGIIGSVVADFWLAYPRWYVSIPAHGLEGVIAGFGKNKPVAIQVLLCAFAGFVMASTYFYVNIFIKGYPIAIISYARDLFGQAGISLVLAMITSKSVQKAKGLWQ
jgi:uncharacterized membrane protein